ncbi:MAG: amino acid decarboxylase [Lachnospiraceae bacterium]|nr:amino acid decarboxylase [Lachnospiraceae bacterium]
MNTPIIDFVNEYRNSETIRLHMPGHKGAAFLGTGENYSFLNTYPWDITEIEGADNLYHPEGIIRESEDNASSLWESGRTVYSTEGSSQCIKTMLYLAYLYNKRINGNEFSKKVLAGRNAHGAFMHGAALLDLDVDWIWPDENHDGLCSCHITAENLKRRLSECDKPPMAVYITTPDYLGGNVDVAALSKVCHEAKTLLLVDNAHGAYFKFLPEKYTGYRHPLDLGADMCCDSAHKTLPALTGAAYLHFSKDVSEVLYENVKAGMALFGSTSPSYPILESLDFCNKYIFEGYREKLALFCERSDRFKKFLREIGFFICGSDPLKITVKTCGNGDSTGILLGEKLRELGAEAEFCDIDHVVLMISPENGEDVFDRLKGIFLQIKESGKFGSERQICTGDATREELFYHRPERVLSIREAFFSDGEYVDAENSLGRICASYSLSCPPAIPIIMPGEKVDEKVFLTLKRYNIKKIRAVAEK